jgi:hypothetical protein
MRVRSSSSIFFMLLLTFISLQSACAWNAPAIKWMAQPDSYQHNWEATPTLRTEQAVVVQVTPSVVASPSIPTGDRALQSLSDAHAPTAIEYSYPKPDARIRSLKTEWGAILDRCDDPVAALAWVHQVAAQYQWIAVSMDLPNSGASDAAPGCLTQVLDTAAQARLKVAIQITAPDIDVQSQSALRHLQQACVYLVQLLRDHQEIQAVQILWPARMSIDHYAVAVSSLYGAAKRVFPAVQIIASLSPDFNSANQLTGLKLLGQMVGDSADCLSGDFAGSVPLTG